MSLNGTNWELTSLNGKQLLQGTTITLNISDGRAAGRSSINQYVGSITEEDDLLRVGPLATTKAFPGPGVVEQEYEYWRSLESATSFKVEGSTLTINHGGGKLTFKALSAAS